MKMADGIAKTRAAIFGRFVAWVVLCGGALLVLGIAAVHAPARIKLIGLFTVGLGILSGVIIGRIAHMRRVHHRRVVFLTAFFLTAIALSGVSLESFRLWRRQRAEVLNAQAKNPFAAQLLDHEAFADSPRDWGRFDDYLTHRFLALGKSSQPMLKSLADWPWGILGSEIILGSLLGGFFALRAVRQPFCVTCDSWHEPQRTVLLDRVAGNQCVTLLSGKTTTPLPNDARLLVECSACRCRTAIPAFRCLLEQPGRTARELLNVSPNAETYLQLKAVLDGDNPTG